jgi:hypothetical protein
VNRADRLANLALFLSAIAAWVVVAFVLLNFDPRRDPNVLLAGALLLGVGASLTLAPLLWIGAFVMGRRIAYRGAWWRAIRRALLAGLIVTSFVVLRGQSALSPALGLFVLVMAVLVEATFSLRR